MVKGSGNTANYEKDIFISYAHIDNQPLKEDLSGWISRFHASLEALLRMRLGKDVHIWRDDKLQGNDQFAEEILEQFDHTAALVSVVSPRYLNSEWCAREVAAFVDRADRAGGVVVKRKARIFKVIKSPVDTEEKLPDIMQQLLGYEFFKVEDGVPVEMDEVYGERYGQDFSRMLNKLAFEVAVLLNDMQSDDEPSQTDPSSTKPVIYLAECSFDMRQYREVLDAELRRLGYTVLPNAQLPRTESNYVNEVDALLNQSQLSIHFVGEKYGVVPDGPSDKSTAVLQNEVAVKHSQSHGLSRVIWIPEGCESEQMRQQNFIESLQSDPAAQKGAELIVGSFEDLRSATEAAIGHIERERERLREGGQKEAADNEPDGQQKQLYMICTEQDRKATVPIRKICRDNGLSVSMPAFKGDAAEIRSVNQHLLETADIIMVYYGAGDEAWKRSVDTEIRKLRGYSGKAGETQCFTYIAAPDACDKQDLVDMEETNLINALDGDDAHAMNGWLKGITNEVADA